MWIMVDALVDSTGRPTDAGGPVTSTSFFSEGGGLAASFGDFPVGPLRARPGIGRRGGEGAAPCTSEVRWQERERAIAASECCKVCVCVCE